MKNININNETSLYVKTKHLLMLLLWGAVWVSGLFMFSCSDKDDDREINSPVIVNIPGRGGYWVCNFYDVTVKGVVCIDPLLDKNSTVRGMYLEESKSKDRYYFVYDSYFFPELQDYLFATFTETTEEGELISKGLNIVFEGHCDVLRDNIRENPTTGYEDWLELYAQGIHIYAIDVNNKDNLQLIYSLP